jgi:hypothetical protein
VADEPVDGELLRGNVSGKGDSGCRQTKVISSH